MFGAGKKRGLCLYYYFFGFHPGWLAAYVALSFALAAADIGLLFLTLAFLLGGADCVTRAAPPVTRSKDWMMPSISSRRFFRALIAFSITTICHSAFSFVLGAYHNASLELTRTVLCFHHPSNCWRSAESIGPPFNLPISAHEPPSGFHRQHRSLGLGGKIATVQAVILFCFQSSARARTFS